MKQIADQESEHRVISAMLHARTDTPYIVALNNLTAADFSDPFAGTIFDLIDHIYRQGTSRPTLVEIMKEGMAYGVLEGKTNFDKLQAIAGQHIEDDNIEFWTGKVKDASKGRRAQQLLVKYAKEIQKPKSDLNSLITEMGSEFFDLSLESTISQTDTGKDLAQYGRELIKEKVQHYRDNIEAAKLLGTVPLDGVPTGLPDLDRLTLGYKPGDLIILAAQTGHGKTAYALNTTNAVCVQNNTNNMGYVNTEMSREQIVFRWGSILSGIPLHTIRAGALTDEQAQIVYESFGKLEGSGLYLKSEPNLTPRKLNEIALQWKMQHDIKLLILDYVGRMETGGDREEWQALRHIIKQQKIMAQNLKIANMVLVQLNPDGTLQGAKQMKNEADIMMRFELITSPDKVADIEKYRQKKFEEFNSYIFLEKSRDSAAGIYIPICFEKDKQQMRQANVVRDLKPPANWGEIGKEVKR